MFYLCFLVDGELVVFLDLFNRFVRRIGVDNLIYGSDWVGPRGEMERQIELIRKLDLTREKKDKILGENISQILNLRRSVHQLFRDHGI